MGFVQVAAFLRLTDGIYPLDFRDIVLHGYKEMLSSKHVLCSGFSMIMLNQKGQLLHVFDLLSKETQEALAIRKSF